MGSVAILWTIGHSNRTPVKFLGILRAHGIRLVVDVRRIPHSRFNPQFNRRALEKSLHQTKILYRHAEDLGGRRPQRRDSSNTGLAEGALRGYADHMETPIFQEALRMLKERGREQPTAVLCAEADPARCHRSLLADALAAQGMEVRHIVSFRQGCV
ncbi:MAG TPA: DUF488 domain-containing protein [Bryobacteraceae bacterium]|nr:DUF488 domain-containing protein [Bryobacteraceae bacterium]